MKKLGVILVALGGALAVVAVTGADPGPSLGYQPQVFVVDTGGSGLRQVTTSAGWKIGPAFSRDDKRLTYVDRGIRVFTLASGKTRRLTRTRNLHPGFASWSPARDELAIVFGSGNEDRPRSHIAIIDPHGGRFRRLASWTGGGLSKGAPVWSPDGTTIVYARERARKSGGDPYCICGPTNVAVVSRKGTRRRVFELHGDELFPQWSRDGRWLLFGRRQEGEKFGLWKFTARGRRLQRVGPPIVYARDASWSHDGKRVAFAGHYETGARDQALFVLDATPTGVPRLIAEHVGNSAWSPVADLIAFTTHDGQVRVTTPDGRAQRTVATFPTDTEFFYLNWSRDGTRLTFTAQKQRPSD